MKKKKLIVILIFTFVLFSTFFVNISINVNANGINSSSKKLNSNFEMQKTQLSFAAFADTHIGASYQYPLSKMADYLDKIGKDLTDSTNLLDFAIHLGDIVNHNTGQINGVGLPWYVNQYKNNLKAYLISNINLPFHCIIGNHDVNDYEMNKDDPHNLTKSLIDELEINNPVYAMMREGILFLVVPELGYITWTHPVLYEWIEYMTSQFSDTTTIILCHQAIEDTTKEKGNIPYRGKQDMDWWASLFKNNSQIKMWIHGHNHYLDWYVGNHSSGETQSVIWQFGHEMAFSAPYSQLNWYKSYEEDRIVIYNISSTAITTATWENNGVRGHWTREYSNIWNIPTTFNPGAVDWYCFPMFLQDNETQLTDMKILSPNITLQLIGTVPMELFYDEHIESPSGWANEIILGFGNDKTGNVNWTNPGMRVHGPTTITFPEKYPYNEEEKQEDGRSGPAYRSFPMGTICSAVPGQTYNFTMTARSISGNGRFKMNVNCTDWGTRTQYSVLSDSESEVFSHIFGSNYETIYGTYTVPDNQNAWFLQGELKFLDTSDYDVSLFSVKRERDSDTTNDFHLYLSGNWYNVTRNLDENDMVNFSVNPKILSDSNGVINFTAFIDGNRYGMVNIIYYEPLLFCRNARFRVNSFNNGIFNLSLTNTITRNSPIKMVIWNSKIFERFPVFTEFLARFLMKGLTGQFFNWIFSKTTPVFKMFPFSTDNMYNQVNILADDGSGMKHISKNGNIWLTCSCPIAVECYIKVTLPNR